MKKKLLSAALALALCLMLLPGTALAAEADWAKDAVKTLNTIYTGSESGPFSADDSTMTVAELNTLMEKTGWETTVSLGSGDLTRGTACAVLADVFDLPIGSGENAAINYLYAQNIISGKANGNLAENAPVSKAEFAVLTYRVLNSVGGGMGSITDLKPGTEEYFAWMYLAARKCVDFNAEDASGNIDESTWSNWITQLTRDEIPADAKPSGEFQPAFPGTSTTKLSAAVQMVATYIEAGGAETIFSDVVQGDYGNGGAYYDGVMYLFDQGLVSGNGDGTFNPNGALCRYELAALLARVDKYQLSDADKKDPIKAYKEHAVNEGYLTPPQGVEITDNTWWGAPITSDYTANPETAIVTREEAIVAVMKACVAQATLDKANTAALDRFSDANKVSEAAKPYIAYAISIGLVSGTGNAQINPSGQVNRGTIGVLLYRTLIGLDTSKMHDYGLSVDGLFDTDTSDGDDGNGPDTTP